MRKLILKTKFSLGDVVMMTAAVRDLHRRYPGEFITDVRTHFPEVWENNPHISYLEERDPQVQVLDCRYPLINYANERPYHCLHGYIDFLNQQLGLNIVPTEFKGDIHLSKEEKAWGSQVEELSRLEIPFWIVAAGGKFDITIKWWETARYQRVIDHFRNRIVFAQIGELGHHHPKLKHTIDLRGQTSVRELIRLVYHAQGCLCGVTALMHLAAAVEPKLGQNRRRACVIVAGAREPAHWEAYPQHAFLHTVGAVPCATQGGCWKSRVVPLRDGDSRDKPGNLCENVSNGLPRCMELITAEDVIKGIGRYFEGGTLSYLTVRERAAAAAAVRASQVNTYDLDSLSRYHAPRMMAEVIGRLPGYPGGHQGRGIIICGGGLKYFPCAWVCVHMLREVGCQLPVQLWHEGAAEMDERMIRLMERLGVECVDASQFQSRHPRRMGGGWELKSYAILHSRFEEVLFLDADNVPVRDPTYLFEAAEYQRTGAIFWPDYGRLGPKRTIWAICDLPYRDEPEFESGQMVIHKRKCWRALNLAFWFNDHSDFFYLHVHGDKETFHLAWRKLNQPYTMVPHPIKPLPGVMCQHDLEGRRLFQHRNLRKWRLSVPNPHVAGFRFEARCLEFLKDLERRWDGKIHVQLPNAREERGFILRSGTCDASVFQDVCERNEYRLPERFHREELIIDVGAHIGSFSFACLSRGASRVEAYEPEPENYRLACHNLRSFEGRVRLHQKAVWRSDRHPSPLLHSGYSADDAGVNTGGGTVLVEAECSPHHQRKAVVDCTSLDRILRRYKVVHLLKLDCEGSEWPILFTSQLLGKVQRICGEYHELDEIPSAAQVGTYRRYGRKELANFLQRYYKKVRIAAHGSSALGLFWAEN